MTHTPTIAEQAQAQVTDSAARLPAEVSSAFAADRAALDARGVPSGVATPGTAMPDAALLDVKGEVTTLARMRGDQPAVVVLYRGRGVRIATSRYGPIRASWCQRSTSVVSR